MSRRGWLAPAWRLGGEKKKKGALNAVKSCLKASWQRATRASKDVHAPLWCRQDGCHSSPTPAPPPTPTGFTRFPARSDTDECCCNSCSPSGRTNVLLQQPPPPNGEERAGVGGGGGFVCRRQSGVQFQNLTPGSAPSLFSSAPPPPHLHPKR